METNNLKTIRQYLPEISSSAGQLQLAMIILFYLCLTTVYFIITDRAIRDWSIDSQILVFMIGFINASLFFLKRDEYKNKFGDMAYRKAIKRFILPSLGILTAVLFHTAYMNGPQIPGGWWTVPMIWLGWLMLAVGSLLYLRSVMAFGLEDFMKISAYFPTSSPLNTSSIRGILRHPIDAALLRMGIGLALLNHNAFALTFAIFLPLGITGWTRLVKERDMIERYGASYLDYRRRVPAFWPKPGKLTAFIDFLLRGDRAVI